MIEPTLRCERSLCRLTGLCLALAFVAGVDPLAAGDATDASAPRDVVYVDNVRGDDAFSGRTAEPGERDAGPYKSIMQAVRKCRVGALISVANTGVDYRESVSIEGYRKGCAESPLVIDGHHARVTGLVAVPADQWLRLRDDVYYFVHRLGPVGSRPASHLAHEIGDSLYGVMPNSNWLGFTKHQGWFDEDEAPRIFFLDGKPGPSVPRLDDLPPGGFFYDSMATAVPEPAGQRRLFFRLPAGRTIDACTVELPLNCGIYVSDDYVTVCNIGSIYSQDDGFAGFWGQNVVLKNIYAACNCDQGVSFHGNSSTLIDGALIERNAGCGIVDVMSCTTIYRNVTVRDNYPSGVLFQGASHAIYNGLIFGNRDQQVSVSDKSAASLLNCLIVGSGPKQTAVSLGFGRLAHCTIVNGGAGVAIAVGGQIRDSVIARCQTPLQIESDALPRTSLQGTILELGRVRLGKDTIEQAGWAAAVAAHSGLAGAIVDAPALAAPLYLLSDDSPHAKAAEYGKRPGVSGKTGCPDALLPLALPATR